MAEMRSVHTDDAPAAIGPYSQAIIANGFIFVSGQTPIDPKTQELTGGSVTDQTHQCFANIKAILEEAGTSIDKVVKATVFLSDMETFAEMNAVYAEHMGDHRPARAAVQAAALPKYVDVEIEVIALVD